MIKMAESLLERALRAYEAWEREQQKRDKEAAEKFAQEVEEWMRERFGDGFIVKPLRPSTALVEIDGVKFGAVRSRNDSIYLELIDECPNCHKIFEIEYIRDLQDLGYAYKRYLLFKEHTKNCKGVQEQPVSNAERVLQLLKELLILLEEADEI